MMWLFQRIKQAFLDAKVPNKLLVCYLVTILLPLFVFYTVLLSRISNTAQTEYLTEKQRVLQQAGSAFQSVTLQADYIASTIEGSSAAVLCLMGSYRNASDEVYSLLRDLFPMFERFMLSSDIVRDVQVYRYSQSFLQYIRYVQDAGASSVAEERLRSLRKGESLVEMKTAEEAVILEIYLPLTKGGIASNIGVCRCSMDITSLIDGISLLPSEVVVVQSGGVYLQRDGTTGSPVPISREAFLALPGGRISVDVEGLDVALHVFTRKSFFNKQEMLMLTAQFLLALGLLSLIYYAIPVVLVRPIVRLSRHLNHEARNGRVRPLEIPHGKDEVGELVEAFNRMAVKNAELTRQVYKSIIAKQRSEYYALQSQIKPHFVFNVLQKINMLVYLERKEETNRLLQRFSDFLRYSIRDNANAATLAGEILHAKNYLDILQDTVAMEFSGTVEEGVQPQQVLCPQFILQPIVENAVKASSARKLAIHYRIFSQGEYIGIELHNDGPLLSDEMLLRIEALTQSDAPHILAAEGGAARSGIGLVNVNTRLRYFYGRDCGLSISNGPGSGVTVTLRIKEGPQPGLQEEML